MSTHYHPCHHVPNLASTNLRLLRPPSVLCRMMIASPGSLCTTASGELCSYLSHTQSLALNLSPTAGRLACLRSLHSARALRAQGNWMLEAGGANCYKLQITSHFVFSEKTVLWLITSSAQWSTMGQMQNQLQSDIELAQHLCIDWLIAAMGSICHESQYNISYDHLKQYWFLILLSL